jgi:hypothetical protein
LWSLEKSHRPQAAPPWCLEEPQPSSSRAAIRPRCGVARDLEEPTPWSSPRRRCLEEPCRRGALRSCVVVEPHRRGVVEEPALRGARWCRARSALPWWLVSGRDKLDKNEINKSGKTYFGNLDDLVSGRDKLDENEIKKSGKTYFGSGAVENRKLVSGAMEISSRYFDNGALEIFLPWCLSGLVGEKLVVVVPTCGSEKPWWPCGVEIGTKTVFNVIL